MTIRPSLGSASNCRISWSQEWHFFGRETQIHVRHHCPGSRIVIKGRSGRRQSYTARLGVCALVSPRLLLVEERKSSSSDLRNQISLPALVIRFANQVHRSPSPRSLATACFPSPQEIVLAPRYTAAFHDSFVLKIQLVPARSRRLFVRLSLLISTCLTSEYRRCVNLASFC